MGCPRCGNASRFGAITVTRHLGNGEKVVHEMMYCGVCHAIISPQPRPKR